MWRHRRGSPVADEEGDAAASPGYAPVATSTTGDAVIIGDGIDDVAVARPIGDEANNDDDLVVDWPEQQQPTDGSRNGNDPDDGRLRPGDHVYVWQSFGVPRAYQRHAIVTSVVSRGSPRVTDEDDGNDDASDGAAAEDIVTVASFYHLQKQKDGESTTGDMREEEQVDESLLTDDGAPSEVTTASGSDGPSNDNSNGRNKPKRWGVYEESLETYSRGSPVRNVRYETGAVRRVLSRAGTVTSVSPDEPGLVLARVRHLLSNPDLLPDHHPLSANGECAAMWCRTGRWCTLQGGSILQITCAGQAGSAVVAGGVASQLSVLLPMPGLWGAAGWYWYVPVTVAYPFLVPLLVTYGLASLVPLEILRRNRKKWKSITDGLNHEFWSKTSEEIKAEYFGTAASADEDSMKTFFGVMTKEEEDRVKYMPVNVEGGPNTGSDDEDESEMINRYQDNMAASFEMDLTGKPPDAQQRQWPLQKQLSGLVRSWRKNKTDNADREEVEKEPLSVDGTIS